MRIVLLLFLFLASGALTFPARADNQTDQRDCAQNQNNSLRNNSLRIAACTRLIEDKRQSRKSQLQSFFYRCLAYEAVDDYAHAIADCMAAVRLNPRSSAVWNNLAVARRGSGDFDGAIAAYDMSLRIDPAHFTAMSGLATIWLERGDADRAIAYLNDAMHLSPGNGELYNSRALAWSKKGEFDKALADASEAIRLFPNDGRFFSVRGKIWSMKGDLVRALEDQNRAIQIGGRSIALSSLNRGNTYRYMGEFDRALDDYKRALELIPDFTAAFAERGLTYEKMGDLEHARAEFEKALNSTSQIKYGINGSGLETARAHLAALDSGIAPPSIPAAPSNVLTTTSIPTPKITVPVAVSAALTTKQGRRVALVLGNSAYRNVPALANPERDAGVVSKALRAVGFETVTVESNGSREQMINALRNFANDAEKADWAIVYYAGHGIEMNGVNYLIPVDARFASDRDVQFEAIPFDQVMASLEGARKLKLVLLDACRDNPFAPQMRKTEPPAVTTATSTAGAVVGSRSIGRGLGEVKVSGATLVVFAAKQGQVALDGDGDDSPFAVAVVQRIATPGVEINKLFRLVRDDVMEATAGRQEPYTYGSLPGSEDFFFVQR